MLLISHEHTSIVASPSIVVRHVFACARSNQLLVRLASGKVLRFDIGDRQILELLRNRNHFRHKFFGDSEISYNRVALVRYILLDILHDFVEFL